MVRGSLNLECCIESWIGGVEFVTIIVCTMKSGIGGAVKHKLKICGLSGQAVQLASVS